MSGRCSSPPRQAFHGVAALLCGAGFYRTWVIDGVLEHSPAEYVRRPPAPAESPTLGLTHPQLAGILTAARDTGEPERRCLGGHAGPPGLAGLRTHPREHRSPC